VIEHPPDRLRRVEFVPFRAAIEADVAFMMTAHVLVPAIDEERPATLSPRMTHELLRKELNFTGVILGDDLEMKAISTRYAVPDAGVQALEAGCDGLLICSGNVELQAATLEAVIHAAEDGRLPIKRVEDALTRHRRAKERFLAVPVAAGRAPLRAILGCDEHVRIADEMSRFL
jgi:beta-N-acetylhexosaminidase